MTRVSDEAQRFISALLFNNQISPIIRTAVVNRIKAPSVREADLRAQEVIVLDGTATNAARVAALDRIILYLKGDL